MNQEDLKRIKFLEFKIEYYLKIFINSKDTENLKLWSIWIYSWINEIVDIKLNKNG